MSQGGIPPSLEKVYKFLANREAWMDEGTCFKEHADPNLFVLERGNTAQHAREQFCGRCKVREECLEYGKKTGSVGVWGGEVLAYGRREEVTLTPIVLFNDLSRVDDLVHPPPLAPHQFPSVLFKDTGTE